MRIAKLFGIISVLILSYLSASALFSPGFFPMHDDTQVARVFEMGRALKDGMFPVRWVSDLGYGFGYPIFNFYSPLSYYVGGFLNILGFDALFATKLMMGTGIILSGIFMYLLAKEFWGKLGGLISALFYVYAPYHAVQIYVRGDVGEFWAYSFIPLVFLGFYKIFKSSQNKTSNAWKWVAISALGLAGLILSHNLTAMMIAPFLLIMIAVLSFISYRNKNVLNAFFIILAAIFGLLLAAFYWLPALVEMKYTNVLSQIGGGADFRDHFVCVQQLWNSQWGFGGSTKGCIDGMSFKIGKLSIILSFAAFMLAIFILTKNKFNHFNDTYHYSDRAKIIFISFGGLIFSILLMLGISGPIWETIKPMEFFQYPWRFLILVSFFSSILAGSLVFSIQAITIKTKNLKTAWYLSGIIMVFFLMYFNLKLFKPQTISSRDSFHYTNEFSLRWTTSKISDEYMPKSFYKPQNEQEIISNKFYGQKKGFRVLNQEIKSNKIKAELVLPIDDKVTIKLSHFPSWNLYVNGKESPFTQVYDGYSLNLPKGEYVLEAKFEETLIEKLGNVLSLIGLFTLFIGIIYGLKTKDVAKKS